MHDFCHHTKRCAISSWTSREQSVCLYLGAGSLVGDALALNGAIGETERSGVWRFYPVRDGVSRSKLDEMDDLLTN